MQNVSRRDPAGLSKPENIIFVVISSIVAESAGSIMIDSVESLLDKDVELRVKDSFLGVRRVRNFFAMP